MVFVEVRFLASVVTYADILRLSMTLPMVLAEEMCLREEEYEELPYATIRMSDVIYCPRPIEVADFLQDDVGEVVALARVPHHPSREATLEERMDRIIQRLDGHRDFMRPVTFVLSVELVPLAIRRFRIPGNDDRADGLEPPADWRP